MIVSIGEVVWDIFTDHKVLGGAPVNVAYHLRSLGQDVKVISRVGDDELGRITLDKLAALDLPVAGVQVGALPTGRVLISLDANNEPSFDIVAPAAWDEIDSVQALAVVEKEPFSLVFGTLAQRHEKSRAAVLALCQKADFLFYDVNLRPPDTSKELVLESLQAANMVKLNLDELFVIAGWATLFADTKEGMVRELMDLKSISVVVVTEGKDGAFVVSKDGVFRDKAEPVKVVDTVGAGDAFFAALIDGHQQKLPWPECLRRANQRGAYVASQAGATPPMPD